MIMPTWLLTDKLEAVFRYQCGLSSADNGITTKNRQEKTIGNFTGDTYNAAYLGLNYYLYGQKFKLMSVSNMPISAAAPDRMRTTAVGRHWSASGCISDLCPAVSVCVKARCGPAAFFLGNASTDAGFLRCPEQLIEPA